MSGPVRVLIVDDHAIVREGLRTILETVDGFEVVGAAADGAEGRRAFEKLRPDVVLLDVHFPGESGLEILATIRQLDPAARVLMISTFDHDEDVVRALRLGARGYVLKDIAPRELLDAIRSVHEGRRSIPVEIGDRLAERVGLDELSAREQEVLQLLAEGRGNREIATSLGISEGTVKAHLNHVFGKLGAGDRTQAVLIALRRGLVHLD